jgi:hypothetical protein
MQTESGGIRPFQKRMKKQNNNLVGRKVLVDWPCRWQGATPANREHLKSEAAAREVYYGQTGEIVAYNPTREDCKNLTVVLDGTKEIVNLYEGAVTITSDPPQDESIAVLKQILAAIEASDRSG